LFLRTQLQSNFNVNNLALVDGRPVTLSLRQMLGCYIKHREEVVTRRTRFDLPQGAGTRPHPGRPEEGLENIDLVVKIIKESQDNDAACQHLSPSWASI
jgi:DNA gyrase subunit A